MSKQCNRRVLNKEVSAVHLSSLVISSYVGYHMAIMKQQVVTVAVNKMSKQQRDSKESD